MEETAVVWSVSDVNHAVREIVEGSLLPFWVGGEVGSLTLHRSGHVYFTLKDARSQLRVTFFNGANLCSRLRIANGSLVELFGNLTVYEPRGDYQFNVKQLRVAGVGDLQRRFEELKQKLAAEGLFDPGRKRPVPRLPRRIGVVTSPGGAAIRDFLQIINRRFPNVNIRIYPCAVQGSSAAAEVAAGVEFFNRADAADVIVVTRGGGSMEDLWPFNEEILARAVADSRIPVISAVGHEIDFSICDFVADLRVPTPSAAAELVIGRREELAQTLDRCRKDMFNTLKFALDRLRARFDRAAGSFVFREPRHLAEMRRQQTDELESRLAVAAERFLMLRRARLDQLRGTLETLDPARQLERGYAILFDPAEERPVTSAQQPAGRHLAVRLADGELKVVTE